MEVAAKYRYYKWDLSIENPERFKRAPLKYQENKPDINIISEDISRRRVILQYMSYVATAILFIIRLFIVCGLAA